LSGGSGYPEGCLLDFNFFASTNLALPAAVSFFGDLFFLSSATFCLAANLAVIF